MKFLLNIIICFGIISCNKLEKKETTYNKVENVNTAEITIKEKTKTYSLTSCNVEGENDSLVIKLNNEPSDSDFELRILKDKNGFKTEYFQTFSVSDSSYKKPEFKIIKQSIVLNKSNYKKGDSINGNLKIQVLAHYTWEKNYMDTIKVTGSFKTILPPVGASIIKHR